MNQNRKVVGFMLMAAVVMLTGSVCAEIFAGKYPFFKKISVISDLVKHKDNTPANTAPEQAAKGGITVVSKPGATDFNAYMLAHRIIRFDAAETDPALPVLMQRLQELQQGAARKIRIAWFGDSMIEADLLTQTFRKKMQDRFGGQGVGFIPFKSVSADIRQTARCKTLGDWQEENLKTGARSMMLHLSGHGFYTSDGELQMKDLTVTDSMMTTEKSLICGRKDTTTTIVVNGRQMVIRPSQHLNRILLDQSTSPSIDVSIKDKSLPVYGVSVEPVKGVVVDNFSFRGITGIELGKLDSNFLHSLAANNPYDLIVLEYGTNLLFRPDDKNYDYYYRKMKPVLQYLRRTLPNSEFLLISSADRAFRYDDRWQTAVGMDSLLKVQAQLAYENNMAFYNMYQSMGGKNTIVRWADSSETYANKDYIHPNHRGAAVLGNMLFDDLLKDYSKWLAVASPNSHKDSAKQSKLN